jgi:hypothetical protein
MTPDSDTVIHQVRHDLRTLATLLISLRTGLDHIDNLDPDMIALCDGAVTRLQTIIDACHPPNQS